MAEAVIEKVKAQVVANQKVPSLGRVFNTYDSAGARRVDSQEFFVGLNDSGVTISKEETDLLMAVLDTNGDGNVNYDDFLVGVRGSMNDTRKGVVDAAFAKFDSEGAGSVKASDLRAAVNVGSHPKVVSGEITEDEAFLEFLSNFGDKNNDGRITNTEWSDYYAAISAKVSDDEHFCNMMSINWTL